MIYIKKMMITDMRLAFVCLCVCVCRNIYRINAIREACCIRNK